MVKNLKKDDHERGYILHNGDMTDDEVLIAVKKKRDKRAENKNK
jgi:hypothetical protein